MVLTVHGTIVYGTNSQWYEKSRHLSFISPQRQHSTAFNSLPPKIRLSHSIDISKRHLNTHLFTTAYTTIVCPSPNASVSKDIIGAI